MSLHCLLCFVFNAQKLRISIVLHMHASLTTFNNMFTVDSPFPATGCDVDVNFSMIFYYNF